MKKLILVVEDDVAISEALKMQVESEGYACITTSRAKNVVPLVFNKNPHLILLDILLPDHDGIEIAKELKKRNYKAPIVMVSARVDGKDVLKQGLADAFLEKPFEMNDLFKILKDKLKAS